MPLLRQRVCGARSQPLRQSERAAIRILLRCAVNLIEEHDAKHGSDYVATLRAYFDTFGDTLAAAARLHVHPNTFRYRLQRLREVAGVQLDDPAERLLLMLQLKLSESSGQPERES